jgi:hypothetical protein
MGGVGADSAGAARRVTNIAQASRAGAKLFNALFIELISRTPLPFGETARSLPLACAPLTSDVMSVAAMRGSAL